MGRPIAQISRRLAALGLGGALLGLFAACSSVPPPSASQAASVSPAPSASRAASGGCAADDVRATSDGWSAGAGSRGADVTVENVADVPCILLPAPEIAILDATGAVVLNSQPDVPDEPPPTLEPASTASFSFQMSNWCDESAALPFRVTVVMTDAPAPIENLPIETLEDLPPCLGEGEPPTISATGWEPN